MTQRDWGGPQALTVDEPQLVADKAHGNIKDWAELQGDGE